MQDTTPWVLVKEDKEQCGALVTACAGLCALLAALVEPYMPSIAQKVVPALHQAWQFHQANQYFPLLDVLISLGEEEGYLDASRAGWNLGLTLGAS